MNSAAKRKTSLPKDIRHLGEVTFALFIRKQGAATEDKRTYTDDPFLPWICVPTASHRRSIRGSLRSTSAPLRALAKPRGRTYSRPRLKH